MPAGAAGLYLKFRRYDANGYPIEILIDAAGKVLAS
jgi:hypothetical protein